MNVLVTGAAGFIAGAIIEQLLSAGHSVKALARSRSTNRDTERIQWLTGDFRTIEPAAWPGLLSNVDAVINCAGILRERYPNDFARIHYETPKALVDACTASRVQRFIQISAIGDEASPFIASKRRFDEYLAKHSVPSVIIQPSVVVSTRGSYGGTSLLRALAALPMIIFVPGEGDQKLQPILLDDLAKLTISVLAYPSHQSTVLVAVGPEIITIRDYLTLLRDWLQLPPARVVRVPKRLIAWASSVGDWLNLGPLGKTLNTLLEHDNVGPTNGFSSLVDATGYTPNSVSATLQNSQSFVQDRWHARLYSVRPIIWLSLVVLWLVSGFSGFNASPEDFTPILAPLPIPGAIHQALVMATSTMDIVFALALLFAPRASLLTPLMLAAVVGYTAILGAFAPGLLFEPLGGLVKNLCVIVLLWVYWVLEKMR